MKRMFIFALAMAMIFGFTSSAVAEDKLAASQEVNAGVVSVTIEYTGKLSALGYEVTGDVSLVSVDPANKPSIAKPTKTDDNGTIVEFAWITPPPSPVTFSYTLSGDIDSASVKYRRTGSEIVVPVN